MQIGKITAQRSRNHFQLKIRVLFEQVFGLCQAFGIALDAFEHLVVGGNQVDFHLAQRLGRLNRVGKNTYLFGADFGNEANIRNGD